MTNSFNGLDGAHELLIKLVEQTPEDWETRKNVVQVLFDAGFHRDASKMVWSAPEIPPVGKEVVFAARIVSKGQPTRAMRLFNTVMEKNMAHPEENLAMAKLLVEAGMPHQAIRFYGAATVMDSGLIDEQFEIALVGADADEKSWATVVADDEFPWEGPKILSEEQAASEEADKENTYAELLNGATQPVPMKAPVREKTKRHDDLPTWRVETKKTSFVAADLLKEDTPFSSQDGEQKSPEVTPDPRALDSQFHALNGNSQSDKPDRETRLAASEPPEVVLPSAAPVSVKETKPVQEVESADPMVEQVIEQPKQSEPVPSSNEVEGDLPAATQKETQVESKDLGSNGAFFKSYDDAHTHLHPEEKASVLPAPSVSQVEGDDTASLEELNSEPKPVSENEAKEDSSVVDHVADTMALVEEREEEKPESSIKVMTGRMTGVFSSLMKKMRRKPAKVEESIINVEDLDLSGVEEVVRDKPKAEKLDEPTVETAAVESKSVREDIPADVVSMENSKPAERTVAESKPVEQSAPKPDSTPVTPVAAAPTQSPAPMAQVAQVAQVAHAAKAIEKPDTDKPSVPKELDGRTQLVSLAPEDGAGFFNQLLARYSNLGMELPRPAVLARDMANVDYLDLINKACSKDLDSFSKLLGLHRVMTNGHCNEWIEDMNLLRKGYGDAVLATVVSKYSVTECREILNSVYSTPAPQAAAV